MHTTVATNPRMPKNRRRRLLGVGIAIWAATTLGALTPPANAEPLPTGNVWRQATSHASRDGAYTPVTGNFTAGDQSTDIYWFSPTAGDRVLIRKDDGRTWSYPAPTQITGNRIPLVGDFAGNDTIDDIFWYGPGATSDILWKSKGEGSFEATSFSVKGTYTPTVVNSKTGSDILWWKQGVAITSVWDFGAATGRSTNLTIANPKWAQPVVGDFNGDTHGDIFWFNSGLDAESLSAGLGNRYNTLPAPSVFHDYKPVVVRLDGFGGSGHDHILWWSATNSNMAVWRADTGFRWESTVIKMQTTKTTTPIPLRGTKNTFIWNWDTAGDDHFWKRNANGSQWNVGTNNTEPSSNAIPIPLATKGTTTQILWHVPGYSTDTMFTLTIAAP